MASSIRVPLVEPGTRPELAEIERSILAQRGDISLLYQVLLNSAPLAAGWEKLLTAIRNQSTLPPALRELVILRIAVLNGAEFEFEAHAPHAVRAGLSPAKIEGVRSLPEGRASLDPSAPIDPQGLYTEDERMMLELADAMTVRVTVPEALMERVSARFDARGVVEAVATIAAYNMVSRLLVALNVAH